VNVYGELGAALLGTAETASLLHGDAVDNRVLVKVRLEVASSVYFIDKILGDDGLVIRVTDAQGEGDSAEQRKDKNDLHAL